MEDWKAEIKAASFHGVLRAKASSQERLAWLKSKFPDEFDEEKLKIEHSIPEPNPKLVEAIREILSKNRQEKNTPVS